MMRSCGMRWLLPILFLMLPVVVFAQSSQTSTETEPLMTMFPHSKSGRFWLSGQMNVIFQMHPSFSAPYTGPNSLQPESEHATSEVFTLYSGMQLTKNTEVFLDVESAGGNGISQALGLAGFTNLDVVRNPTLGRKPYLARLMIRQMIPLSSEMIDTQRGWISVASQVPAKRIEIRFGKMSIADFFDLNGPGSDSHLQFMNWTVDNNGGYDYAADTRGYTYALLVDYENRNWGVRFGEALMPTVANGITLDTNLRDSRAENLEFELRKQFLAGHDGVLRLLTYVNHANMGDYQQAIDAFLNHEDPTPNIELHREPGTIKYGFGINFEQSLTSVIRVFGRSGWNEGKHESFAYTEVNSTLQVGSDFQGDGWGRKEDRIGVVFVTNGLSDEHARYLELGGLGFLLGDGNLNYGRENILETYYTAHFWRGIFGSADLQWITHPGYNRDRGPAVVFGSRLHVEF